MNQLDYQQPFHPGSFAQFGAPAASAFVTGPAQAFSTQQQAPFLDVNGGNAQQPMPMQSPGAYAPGYQPPPRQHHPQQQPFTSAPSAPTFHAPAALPQHQRPISQSPIQNHSPYAHNQPQHQPQQPQQRPSPAQHYPMAAPPLPQTPTTAQQQAAGSGAASPKTPQTPGTQSRQQQQVALLLEINVELLQEINNLQAQGKGGATHPNMLNQPIPGQQDKKFDKMAAEDYIQCLRRVQANLTILAPLHAGTKLPTPGPVHMTPPPHMPKLQAKYDQLKEAFPGWQGFDHKIAEKSAASPVNVTAANGTSYNSTPTQA